MALLWAPAVILALLFGFMVLHALVGWLSSLIGGRESITRWEAATAPDPGDPEGLTPVVRMIERELEGALARGGTRLVNRAGSSRKRVTCSTVDPDQWWGLAAQPPGG